MIWYAISSIVLLAGLWCVSMYRLWKKETGTEQLFDEELTKVTPYVATSARYARKSLYFLIRTGKAVRAWCTERLASFFFLLFPSARKAFIPRDELTGLSTGPSSYFLMSVSEYAKQATKKKTGRKKKIV